MNDDEFESMRNLVAEIFRIEKSASLDASIPPFLSFLKWTTKAGAQQDSLKRAIKVWFTRAQRPAKLIGEDDAIEEMALEEMEPMLSERIQKWTDELIQQGKAAGRVEGKAEGKAEGITEGYAKVFIKLFEKKFGPMSDNTLACVTTASANQILLFSERLLIAHTPDDIFISD